MKSLIVLLISGFISLSAFSQNKKPVYHPCFLLDSVEKKLPFIQANIRRIFVDSFDCRQTLLDSMAMNYIRNKNKKYLDALSSIRQYPGIDVKGLYTDIISRLMDDDFGGFLNQLYASQGKFLPLENELIATMNMIVNGRSLKQKYEGLLNVEISKAGDKKDARRLYYLKKLKTRIEKEKY